MAVAAELPDIDTLWGLRGPVASFTHHRGMTHTLVGLPVEAALLVGVVYAVHTWRMRRGARVPAAPVRWGLLYGFALFALLSHLFLDFTNNYGIRPFFPFNPRWYAGSFVFIFDPLLFTLLVLAFVMPWLLGLIGSEVGARRTPFRGAGWARGVLVCMALVWSLRAFEHSRAVDFAAGQTEEVQASTEATPAVYAQPDRVLANPDPFSPFHWHAVADLGGYYRLADVDLLRAQWKPASNTWPKPAQTPSILAAEESPLGRAYMDWSTMPIVTEPPRAEGDAAPAATVVTFRDPRFMVDLPGMRGSTPPLTATVTVDPRGRVLAQTMNGSAQR
jgi:inner membrane protein